MRVLITGVAGFIGHHVLDVLLQHTDWDVVGLDRIDQTSSLARLKFVPGFDTPRFKFVWHDLRSEVNELVAREIGPVDVILHLAASTHVDRSISSPYSFVQDNVLATCHILEYARTQKLKAFNYFSTDEVFGPAPDGVSYKDWDRYRSGNPYSATKAAGEELALSYNNTYGIPMFITHCMNVIGERQHPEKFVPKLIGEILRGAEVQLHADPTCKIPGSRSYIYAKNVGHALRFLLLKVLGGALDITVADKFNIAGEREMTNLEMAIEVAWIVQLPLIHKLVDFHSSRPGHDLRYALDGSKLQQHGFVPPGKNLSANLKDTVNWYLHNRDWLLT